MAGVMKVTMLEISFPFSRMMNAAHSIGKGLLPRPVATLMSVLPLAPLEMAGNSVLRTALARRPGMFSRLGVYSEKLFAIDPVDCPFVFLLEPCNERPRVRVRSSLDGIAWDARISAGMLVLLGLLDGTYDGDALFFTRDLFIEGDTAAVLALRNAIEDAELEPALLLGAPEFAAPFVSDNVRKAADALRRLLGAPASATAPGDKFQ